MQEVCQKEATLYTPGMTKKPATRIRDAVQALAALPDPTERALAAGEMTDAVRDATTEVATIRSEAIQQLRTNGLTYRAIGELLGVHFTRVKQLEKGETTGRRKKPTAATVEATAEPAVKALPPED